MPPSVHDEFRELGFRDSNGEKNNDLHYASPFVSVMLVGLVVLSVWKVWLEGRRRDFAPFATLPPWPLDPEQKAPAIGGAQVKTPPRQDGHLDWARLTLIISHRIHNSVS